MRCPLAHSPFHKPVQTLGNGSKIQVAVDHDPVPVGARDDGAPEADILDDCQQVAFRYGLHHCSLRGADRTTRLRPAGSKDGRWNFRSKWFLVVEE
jgi:hypothetical protein